MLTLTNIKQWFNLKTPTDAPPGVSMTGLAITATDAVSIGLLRQVSRLTRLYQVPNPDQAIENEIMKHYVGIFNETGHALTTREKAEAYLKQITTE